MKKALLLTLCYLGVFCLVRAGQDEYRFEENRNQWDSRILYKAAIPSGTLFLEKGCFTYHLFDHSVLKAVHAHKINFNLDTFKVKGHAFKVHFANASPEVAVDAEDDFEDYTNYFIGKDRSRWAAHVKSYKRVNYQNLYDGIDLKVYTQSQHLKYDFVVLPNADPSIIKLSYEGLEHIYLREGNIILKTSLGNIVEQKPYAYQMVQGKAIRVNCYYVLKNNTISFAFPDGYNKNQTLIIDPTLIFSTYSGSTADNFGYTATYDSDGFLYSGSSVFDQGYPVTAGAYDTTFNGGNVDIGITKYDTSGTKRIYSTYVGGQRTELPHSLIVDNNDNLLIFGTTSSENYPVTPGAYDTSLALTFPFPDSLIDMRYGIGVRYTIGADIIISKLSNDGSSLLASTYLGGSSHDGLLALAGMLSWDAFGNVYLPPATSLRYNYADEVRGEIEVDNDNNIYIATCTKSQDFPIVGTSSVFNGGIFDAVVVKLDNNLSNILWSTFLGGDKDDAAYSIELDSLNNIYVAGGTTSSNLPTTSGVLHPTTGGGRADGFIYYLDNTGSLVYATYYGTPAYDQVYFLDLDIYNNVYVFGQTSFTGSPNPYIHNAAFNQPNSGQFISKISPSLDSLCWSTTFGNGSGEPNISPTAFLVDLCSKIYLSGWGGSPGYLDFLNGANHPFNMYVTLGPNPPTDYYDPTTTGNDFYLFVLEDDASSVHYASYFGGDFSEEHVDGGTSRFDKKGKIYQAMCAGCGGNTDMPLKPTLGMAELPAPNNNSCNIGVFKMDFRLPTVIADFTPKNGCSGDTILFINKSQMKHNTTFEWSFGDGGTSTDTNAVHAYQNGGYYYVRLVVKDTGTCNLADTVTKKIFISKLPGSIAVSATTDKDTVYKGKSTTLHAYPQPGYLYSWTPAESLNNSLIANPVATPPVTTTYTVAVSDPLLSKCKQEARVTVNVFEVICGETHIYVPNAFTPNGDGKNDVLYVRSNNILDFFFTIYNRWGEKVFETRNLSNGWDGVYKEMDADPGVFDYYLEGTCIDGQKFFKKGNVTLIR